MKLDRNLLLPLGAVALIGSAVSWLVLFQAPPETQPATTALPVTAGAAPQWLSPRADMPQSFGHVVRQPETGRFVPVRDVRQLPKFDSRVSATADLDPALALGPSFTLNAPFGIIDAMTFSSGPWAIMLADVRGPDREAICFNSAQRLFACGLAARAALNNTLKKHSVRCETRQVLNAERVVATCATPEGDLAMLLARQGWVRPDRSTRPDLMEAARAAEEGQLGLWNGGWRIR
jgi:endonuclease YncB( thermonuclease family)